MHRVDTGLGPTLSLELGPAAVSRPPAPLELSSAPGASLLLQGAWALDSSSSLELACVQAPASRWVPGLDEAILAGASAVVRGAGGFSQLEAQPTQRVGDHLEQPFRATGGPGGAPRTGVGKHWLGTSQSGEQVVLCSLVCSSSEPGASRCEQSMSAAVGASFGPLPPPGMAVRAVGWAASHPLALLVCLAVAAGLALLLLHRARPRPRP